MQTIPLYAVNKLLIAIFLLAAHTLFVSQLAAKPMDINVKQSAILELRQGLAAKPYRLFKIRQSHLPHTEAFQAQLGSDGLFADLIELEQKLRRDGDMDSEEYDRQRRVGELTDEALTRIWCIAETLRGQPREHQPQLRDALMNSAIHYGGIETSRPDGRFRFHPSCFAIPTAAINTYFCLFPEMEAAEAGETQRPLVVEANAILRAVALQAWTLPGRNDETDLNPAQIERFRHHVWWVGGNGLTYRSVLPAAVLLSRSDMVDVLAEVAHGALSAVSYNTQDTAFWEEGMTVDGAGWGHGRQALVFGYPFDGTASALGVIQQLKGTPWDRPISEESVQCLMNLLRGSTWFWYAGRVSPMYGRSNMVYKEITTKSDHKGKRLAGTLLAKFDESLTAPQRSELEWYVEHAAVGASFTDHPPKPSRHYVGVRYFWNQDDLVVKKPDWHFIANMSSSRSHGLESAASLGVAGFNLFTADGQALFQHRGDESGRALGASDLKSLPGITARDFDEPLNPIVHWTGYHSKHDFAGGVARGEFGCAGFVFEKQDGQANREDPTVTPTETNPKILGVFAQKSYFVFDDTVVALGANIRDMLPEQGGGIRTGVEQTLWTDDVVVSGIASQPELIPHSDASAGYQARVDFDDHASGPVFVHHGAFTYALLPDQTSGSAQILLETRETQWNRLATNNLKAQTPDHEDMLQITFEHGSNPRSATYGYVVRYSPNDHVIPHDRLPRVLSNTADLQAVASSDGSTLQAVFYKPDTELGMDGWKVSVSAPAVLMIQSSAKGWFVTASDPLQLAEPIPLTVTITKGSDDGEATVSTTLVLPKPPYAGSQAETLIQFNP